MAIALVLAVVVIDVGVRNAFNGFGNSLLAFMDKKMEVAAHETVGIVVAAQCDGQSVTKNSNTHNSGTLKRYRLYPMSDII